MSGILEVIDPEGDIKEQLQAIRDNFLSIQKDGLKAANQVLAFSYLSGDVSVPETTPTSKGLEASITTSGGLVMLFAVASVETNGTATATATIKLTLDGEVKGTQYVSLLNLYSGVACIPWVGQIGAGVHKIDVLFSTDAGATLVNGGSENQTYLIAVELIV